MSFIFHAELSCLSVNMGGYFEYLLYESKNKKVIKLFVFVFFLYTTR
jgi:hypothetical protein